MTSKLIIFVAVVAFSQNIKVQGLRIASIEVPPAVMNATPATLACNYELEGDDQLYSVKWYKNYVEFYRFQPVPDNQGVNSAASDNQANSKHEFELDGISLNLVKCNATHVYLRQTSLASEGTYKCEVSADSPSFATVKKERQMKVYVLPKQKLSIVDNSVAAAAAASVTTTANGAEQRAQLNMAAAADVGSQQQQQQQAVGSRQTIAATSALVFNINDFVNLTCLAGPSKPAAQLSWYLNDALVPPTSKWLSLSSSSKVASLNSNQENDGQTHLQPLIESKLTIAFRLQPSHFWKGSNGSLNQFPYEYEQQQRHNQQRMIPQFRLMCLSRMSFNFVSESRMVISGGRATLKNGQTREQSATQLPAPSSLQAHQRSEAHDHLVAATAGQESAYPIYRWPRPQQRQQQSQSRQTDRPIGSQRRKPNLPDNQSESPYDLATNSDQSMNNDQLADQYRHSSLRPTSGLVRPFGPVVVWTSRQLRAQSEYIEQMLRQSRPNQLEPPTIEALLMNSDDEAPIEEADSTGESNSHSVASFDEQSPKDQEHENETTINVKFNDWPTSSTLAPVSATTTAVEYELNDRVQFTCFARIEPPVGANSTRSVHLKWFINDKEILTKHVNAFDGSNFHHIKRNQHHISRHSRGHSYQHTSLSMITSKSRPNNGQRVNSSGQNPSVGSFYEPTTIHSSSETNPSNSNNQADLEQTTTKAPTTFATHMPLLDSDDLSDPIASDNQLALLLELTPSLMQLKELNLKCRISVEQPLIEYENQLVASVPGSQFILVDSQRTRGGGNSLTGGNKTPTGYTVRVSKHKHPPGSSAISSQISPHQSGYLIHVTFFTLLIEFVVSHSTAILHMYKTHTTHTTIAKT